MADQTIRCPHCGHEEHVLPQMAGESITCPNVDCAQTYAIPGTPSAAAAPPPQAAAAPPIDRTPELRPPGAPTIPAVDDEALPPAPAPVASENSPDTTPELRAPGAPPIPAASEDIPPPPPVADDDRLDATPELRAPGAPPIPAASDPMAGPAPPPPTTTGADDTPSLRPAPTPPPPPPGPAPVPPRPGPPPMPPSAGPPPLQSGGYRAPRPAQDGSATVALVLGILSILFCWFCGLGAILGGIAVYFGVTSKRRIDADESLGGRELAMGGLITGGIGLAFGILWILYFVVAMLVGLVQ